jgi:hypothetical protein
MIKQLIKKSVFQWKLMNQGKTKSKQTSNSKKTGLESRRIRVRTPLILFEKDGCYYLYKYFKNLKIFSTLNRDE